MLNMLKASITVNGNLECNNNDANYATKPETNHEYTTIWFTALHETNYLHGT